MHLSIVLDRAESPIPVILIILIALPVIGVAIYLQDLEEKKRREALGRVGRSLGLQFSPAKDRALAKRHALLDELREGSNRYTYNVMRGDFKGHPVELFNHHYQIRRSRGKTSSIDHYHRSILICRLPRSFPSTRISRSCVPKKLTQMTGFEDIPFESTAFSRRYTVRSKSKRFAYEFIHPRTIEYLLHAPDLNIEIEANVLALVTKKPLDPGEIVVYLGHLDRLRQLMPGYIFA